MSRITVKNFVSHEPMFIAGKNFKAGTLVTADPDTDFSYDLELDKLFVVHKGFLRVVNGATVAHWEPLEYEAVGVKLKNPEKAKPISLSQDLAPKKPIKAQVEVPHEKVQNPPMTRSVRS